MNSWNFPIVYDCFAWLQLAGNFCGLTLPDKVRMPVSDVWIDTGALSGVMGAWSHVTQHQGECERSLPPLLTRSNCMWVCSRFIDNI